MTASTTLIRIMSVLGMLLSAYALYVEHRKAEDELYVAACDINSWVACSKVFTSKYGRMMSLLGLVPSGHALDLPNAAYGLLFYVCAFFHDDLAFLPRRLRAAIMLFAASAAAASSVWLGYVLYNILHDACIVCISTYVVNTVILIAAISSMFAAAFPPVMDKKTQ